MKRVIHTFIACLMTTMVWAQYDEVVPINMKLDAARTIIIDNIFGDVKVEGYSGKEVVVTGKIRLYAETKAGLEKGKKEFSVASSLRNDTLLIHNKSPYIKSRFERSRGFCWNSEDHAYNFQTNVVVKVPMNLNVVACTINDGDVTLSNVSNEVVATNVNGSIYLSKVNKVSNATTVNGDIEISYVNSPQMSSRFHTVNGDVVLVADDISGTFKFKSMHGDIYSAFDYEMVAPSLVKTKDSRGTRSTYKLEKEAKIKIGDGTYQFSFETINGNMYLKNSKS